jgi:predicted DNA-binding transcriptional regulator AlpA
MAGRQRRKRTSAVSAVQRPLTETHPPERLIDLMRVISEREAANVLNLSIDTLRRRGRDGTGPIRISLSARRIGYRVRDLAAWLDQRASETD